MEAWPAGGWVEDQLRKGVEAVSRAPDRRRPELDPAGADVEAVALVDLNGPGIKAGGGRGGGLCQRLSMDSTPP